ncbi:MAG TPA: hypothetical protein VFC46_10105 [Humisphaera sp.]|nr:hypothetical protein [Humisphaera sp.]
MASDRLVTAAHILKATMELDRRGSTKVLTEWEKQEPDLLEYFLENLTRLHHRLGDLGLSAKDTRTVYRHSRKTTLVCIMALRQAYRDLLDDQAGAAMPEPDADPDSDPSA